MIKREIKREIKRMRPIEAPKRENLIAMDVDEEVKEGGKIRGRPERAQFKRLSFRHAGEETYIFTRCVCVCVCMCVCIYTHRHM